MNKVLVDWLRLELFEADVPVVVIYFVVRVEKDGVGAGNFLQRGDPVPQFSAVIKEVAEAPVLGAKVPSKVTLWGKMP